MKPWKQSLRDGLWPGNLAGALSALSLAWRGQRELARPLAPLNAPSQWVWGERALREDGGSWRFTGLGLVIHQASAMMWGVLYERYVARPRATEALHARDALLATAAAATVDFALTPRRFTPGFERRLSIAGVVCVYAAFAAGIALGSHVVRRSR